MTRFIFAHQSWLENPPAIAVHTSHCLVSQDLRDRQNETGRIWKGLAEAGLSVLFLYAWLAMKKLFDLECTPLSFLVLSHPPFSLSFFFVARILECFNVGRSGLEKDLP